MTSTRPQVSRSSTIVNLKPTAKGDTDLVRDDDLYMDREFVIGETLEEWLDKGNVDNALKRVLISLAEIAFKEISHKI